MKRSKPKRETKFGDLAKVVDFLNADFASESGKRGRWAHYVPEYLSLRRAGKLQASMFAAYSEGVITPDLLEAADEYANRVEWASSSDRRSFKMYRDISHPASSVLVSLISITNNAGAFWRLRRCAQADCKRFFVRRGKQKYCSSRCLKEHNSSEAQQRVETARQNRRYEEIRTKLLRVRAMAERGAPFSEILGELPEFDPKLLANIIEAKKPLKELASEVKYKNRKILMEAKI